MLVERVLRGLLYRFRGSRELLQRGMGDRRSSRNRSGRAALSSATPAFRVPEGDGFMKVEGLEADLVAACVADTKARFEEAKERDRQLNRKPYFIQFTELSDYEPDSAPFRLATHPSVVRAAADYLGSFPLLYNVSAIFSPSTAQEGSEAVEWKGSQLFHRDGEDRRLLKLWVLCSDVTDAHGPTLVMPAARSQRIANRLRYSQGTKLPDEPFRDDWEALVAAVGPEGTVYATDTARCFHLGSRTTEECSRLVLMVHYMTEHSKYFNRVARERGADGVPGIDPARIDATTRSLLALG